MNTEPDEGAQTAEVVQPADAPAAAQETITEPAKLLRIASMVRELLDETRQASLDEAGRKEMLREAGLDAPARDRLITALLAS